jgi:hypothetical protein
MLTMFTTAKPFHGHIGMIQRNALKSWTLLHPDVEIILFGDDEGAAEACRELGIRHEPHVEKHESGLNYVGYMFGRASQIAENDYLCYSNCDIVLMDDFWRTFERAKAWRKDFLMVAQRWDTDVNQAIDFERPDWARQLRRLARTTGLHQIADYIDFFLFRKGLYQNVPPLVVGRSYWDHWMIWKALDSRVPVLDATEVVVPVHQNHEYTHHPQGKAGTHTDALALRNRELAGGGRHLRSMLDATHRFRRSGRIGRTILRRQFQSPAWLNLRQSFAEKTFSVRNALGLRRRQFDE